MADKLQYSSQLFESLAIKWSTEWSYRIAEIIGTVQRQDQQNIIFSIWQSNGKNLIKHSQHNIKWFSITVCLPRFFDFPTALSYYQLNNSTFDTAFNMHGPFQIQELFFCQLK